ncbi:cation:proton antiporter [Halorientalis salina]|uniref:cation:proton antiporter n=1 Tax=Halorientalis salina TaxID=2932266 RepID=UPI0010ACCB74|nr:cation:proton antiporter [Halorientalis salina]
MAELLLEVGVLFTAVAAVGAIASRVRQSVIPFYIVVGMVLSEFVAGRAGVPYVSESEFVSLGAELGIVLLLFFLGLEFNIDRLLAKRTQIGKSGTIDLLINFSVGFALGWLFFDAALPAFLVAGIVYISSSAIITKSLLDLGWIANNEADAMLGTLVYEDLVIAVYIAIASALVLGGGDVGDMLTSVGTALGFIVVLLVVVYWGTPLFSRLLDTDNREFLVLRTVGVTVLVAGVALALGVSEAVAAFFVGMGFSATDGVAHLEELLEPLRDAFAAVFFFWIGLVTDPLSLGGVVGLVAAAVVVTTPTKVLSGYLGGRAYGLDVKRSTRVGLGMTTRGEFSLIIATVAITGANTGVLSASLANTINAFAVGYVLVMAVLGTTLMQYAGPLERRAVEWFGHENGSEEVAISD